MIEVMEVMEVIEVMEVMEVMPKVQLSSRACEGSGRRRASVPLLAHVGMANAETEWLRDPSAGSG